MRLLEAGASILHRDSAVSAHFLTFCIIYELRHAFLPHLNSAMTSGGACEKSFPSIFFILMLDIYRITLSLSLLLSLHTTHYNQNVPFPSFPLRIQGLWDQPWRFNKWTRRTFGETLSKHNSLSSKHTFCQFFMIMNKVNF